MMVPFVLFVAAVAAVLAAVNVPGWSDLLLLAVPCAIASLFLLARLIWHLLEVRPKDAPQNWIVVDGSNVLHWQDNLPQIAVVCDVVQHLVALGFSPLVVFDATAGRKIAGQYKHDLALSRLLGLPEARVMVVEKRTSADPVLLSCARGLGARIVTNDRYRDWAEVYPEVRGAGHLIRGGYRDGAVWLDVR